MRNHYWKKAGPAAAPSEIIVVDTETWHADRARVQGGEWHTLRLGCALSYRLERGKRTRVCEFSFTTADIFWEFVASRIQPRRPVWVFAHNAAYDLGVLDGWAVIASPDYECQKVAVSQSLLFVKGYWHGCGLNFCDTGNYFHTSLANIGRAVGITKMEMPEQYAPDSDWEVYCRNDVNVTAAGLDSLINFVRENELGPWQPSIAGLAFSAYRSRFMHHKVLVHNYRDTLRMERNAYCGGIVDTNFVGLVANGPVHEVDVVSMYPAMCLKDLPSKFIHADSRCSKEFLRRLLETKCVIADVEIETDDYRYPLKTKQGTVYPLGSYRTCLAHPELEIALERGHVKWVHYAAWYERKPIFKDYMEYFGAKKIQYKADGNDCFSTICKYYANSLYGKTGQESPSWLPWGEDSLRKVEIANDLPPGSLEYTYDTPPELHRSEETFYDSVTKTRIKTRDYWGFVEVQCGRHESRDSAPAIAATVTSYARVYLREAQHIAGQREWYYSDTDSIWLSDTGLARLEQAGYIRPGVLGALEYKGSYDWLRVNGPKDYETPQCVKLKGVRPNKRPMNRDGYYDIPVVAGNNTLYFQKTEDGKFVQMQFPSTMAQLTEHTSGGVFVREVHKTLHRRITKCEVMPDGWTKPLVYRRSKLVRENQEK